MKQKHHYSYKPQPEHYMQLMASLRYIVTAAGLFAWLSILAGYPHLAGMGSELAQPFKQINTILGIAAIPVVVASWGMHYYVAKRKNLSKPSRAWMAWQIISSLGVFGVVVFFLAAVSGTRG